MEDLFWSIYNIDNESELDELLKSNPVFSNDNWKPYGNNSGNFGTFESQQNDPIPALVEKITNSIDATLIKECLIQGINPKSSDAPKSMIEAVELFYNVKDGEIGELDNNRRRELSENIQIIAVGDNSQPSIIVYDNGEGQSPENFENTFLSLHKNNKTNIHFVQGKYNMGSTGAVVFCGEKKYQLIASKRHYDIENINHEFGFTLVRRHPLTKEEEFEYGKATWYEYFCPNGSIPSFEIDEIDLGLYNRKFRFGSIVKLYSYELPRGSKSDLTLDLWRDLNQYMYHLPIPISVYEKRNYRGKSPHKPVLGNRTRIHIDSRDNVEKVIQYSLQSREGFGTIPINIVLFNSGVDHGEFIKNKSIIFTQNGQVHGFEGQSFISQDLGFQLLKKELLIHVDCTEIPTSVRQDLFMSNRTHLKRGNKTQKLRDEIIEYLKSSSELKKLNNQRKESLIHNNGIEKDQIEELLSKLPIDDDITNLLRKDGSLNFLKRKGHRLNNNNSSTQEEIKLKRFPSIFNLKLNTHENGKLYKVIPINQHGNIEIETDVDDDYLFRPSEKGKLKIEILEKRNHTNTPIQNTSDNPNDVSDILSVNREGPNNGTIKLIVKPTEKARVGDWIDVRATLSGPGEEFECLFQVRVDKEIINSEKKEKGNQETFPNLPTPRKAYENPVDENELGWNNSQLNWDGSDIVKVITGIDDEGDTIIESIIVNMDANVFKSFLSKNRLKKETEIEFHRNRFFLSVYLHTLILYSIIQKMRKSNDQLETLEVDEFISSLIKPYSSFLLYESLHLSKILIDD